MTFHVTHTQAAVAAVVLAAAVLVLAGFALDEHLRRREARNGWRIQAKNLGRQLALQGQVIQQLHDHLGHVAAELERVKLQQAQIARRPPSDPTVRLGIVPRHTAQMPRIGGARRPA
jgi:hypothetical protein